MVKHINTYFEDCLGVANAHPNKFDVATNFDGETYIKFVATQNHIFKGGETNIFIVTKDDTTATLDLFLDIVEKELEMI